MSKPPAGTRSAGVAAAVAGVGLVALTAVTLAAGTRDHHPGLVFFLVVLDWAAFAGSVRLIQQVPVDLALRLVVGVGVALQAVAAAWPPRTSDDVYRYAWDGRVGNHGIDPYRYPPNAVQLTDLRVPWLFPPGHAPLINRPDAPTIYPPVAQLWFRLVDVLSPDRWGIRGYQIAAASIAVGGTLLLIRVLRSLDRDPRLAALWAWCPLVVLESGNNAHIDGVAAVLTLAALALLARRRSVVGGLVLGAAIGVKLVPALVLPAVLRRRPVATTASALVVVALSYLPHLLAVGGSVIGYLPSYLNQEGFDSGDRFALLRLTMPEHWAPYAALVVAGLTAVLVMTRSDPTRPWVGASTVIGVAFLVTTPAYPWYTLLLAALCIPAERPEWLAVCAAGYLPYLAGWTGWSGGLLQQIGYGAALLTVLAVRRARRTRRARSTGVPARPVVLGSAAPFLRS